MQCSAFAISLVQLVDLNCIIPVMKNPAQINPAQGVHTLPRIDPSYFNEHLNCHLPIHHLAGL